MDDSRRSRAELGVGLVVADDAAAVAEISVPARGPDWRSSVRRARCSSDMPQLLRRAS